MAAATPDNPLGITPEQRVFCHEYVRDFNGRRAAIAAGYAESAASQQAYDLLTRPHVQAYLQLVHRRQLDAVDIKADRVLEEIAKLCFLDINAIHDPEGNLLPIKQWPYGASGAVAGIEVEERFQTQTVYGIHEVDPDTGEPIPGAKGTKQRVLVGYLKKIKFWDKNAALEKLMKHLGQYELDNLQRQAGVGAGATPQLSAVKAALVDIFTKRQQAAQAAQAAQPKETS